MKSKPDKDLSTKVDPDNPKDYFKGVKIPLKSVLKNPEINSSKILDTVLMANKIVTHTLMFMKLYLMHHYKRDGNLPVIDKQFVNACMKTTCSYDEPKKFGRPPSSSTKLLKEDLSIFYSEIYEPLIVKDQLDYKYMNTILDYLTIDILTKYENNIKMNYTDYVEKYVNIIWKKDDLINGIKSSNLSDELKKIEMDIIYEELKQIKSDLLSVSEERIYESNVKYHNWINLEKLKTRPQKVYKKDSLFYDIKCDPFDYLPCMIYMMSKLESQNNDVFIYNVFPMRSEIVPKHIRLDTTTLVHLLMTKKQGLKTDYLFEGNLKRNEDKIWSFFFRTERSCFKKLKYTFHHMIETDGISCSILLIRNDLINKRIPKKKEESGEKYLEDLSEEEIQDFQDKKIIAIDPGVCDLIYCTDGHSEDSKTFRYSQDQRRKETKSKKYSKLILEFKKEKIDSLSVIEHETELSDYNRKTLNIDRFKEYITKKCIINSKLSIFYQKYIFRKLKLNGYLNIKRSEQKMIKNFNRLFEIKDPKDILICFGDFEQKKHMKFKEPTKGIGMRSLFRSYGFSTYLIDEHKTSCMCSKCETSRCEKFMYRKNPRPFRDQEETQLVHGLIRCKNGCSLWNRDRNGSSNIYKISRSIVDSVERPKYLQRDVKNITKTKIHTC